MKRYQIILVFFLLGVMLGACKPKTIYSEYRDMPVSGWNADSLLTYSFEITDTLTTYDVLINFRHTQRYQYQNMWMFVSLEASPVTLQTDTIEFYLADERGRWLGNGYGNVREMPVLYKRKVSFPKSGIYSYRLQQGMRDEVLRGVGSVGMKIVKSDGEE